MSSWVAAIESPQAPWGLDAVASHTQWDVTHVLRDPRKVVTSIAKLLDPHPLPRVASGLLSFVREHCNVPASHPVGQAVEFFNEWTELCRAAARRTVRLNQVDAFFAEAYPAKASPLSRRPGRDVNTRGALPPLTDEQLTRHCTPAALITFAREENYYHGH